MSSMYHVMYGRHVMYDRQIEIEKIKRCNDSRCTKIPSCRCRCTPLSITCDVLDCTPMYKDKNAYKMYRKYSKKIAYKKIDQCTSMY